MTRTHKCKWKEKKKQTTQKTKYQDPEKNGNCWQSNTFFTIMSMWHFSLKLEKGFFFVVILTFQGRNGNNAQLKRCKHNFTFSSFPTNYCHNKHHLSYLPISSEIFCFHSNKKAFQTSSPSLTAARQRLFRAEPFLRWINEYLHSSSGNISSSDSRVDGDKDTNQSESRRNKLCACVFLFKQHLFEQKHTIIHAVITQTHKKQLTAIEQHHDNKDSQKLFRNTAKLALCLQPPADKFWVSTSCYQRL